MTDPIDPPADAPVDPPVDPAAPTPEQAQAIADEDPRLVIERLEAEVKAARQEAGKARINAKQAAADEARAELAQQVGKALGLVADDPVDPAALTQQIEASQAQARQAQIELAVYRAADTAGGDPIALLDSRTFLETAASIDPSDSDALVAAIGQAVTANPRLGKAAPGPQGMKPNPAQGGSAGPPPGIGAQIAAAEAAGDVRLAIQLKSQQLVTK